MTSLSAVGRETNRHIFSGDLHRLQAELRRAAKGRRLRILQAANLDLPSVALVLPDLDALVAQAAELGGGVLYVSPDELGVMLEEHIDVVDELRGSMPEGGDREERAAADEMIQSLVRLQTLQNELGGPAFRVGYLRNGVFHEILLEDDAAAAAAALVDLTLRGELPNTDDLMAP